MPPARENERTRARLRTHTLAHRRAYAHGELVKGCRLGAVAVEGSTHALHVGEIRGLPRIMRPREHEKGRAHMLEGDFAEKAAKELVRVRCCAAVAIAYSYVLHMRDVGVVALEAVVPLEVTYMREDATIRECGDVRSRRVRADHVRERIGVQEDRETTRGAARDQHVGRVLPQHACGRERGWQGVDVTPTAEEERAILARVRTGAPHGLLAVAGGRGAIAVHEPRVGPSTPPASDGLVSREDTKVALVKHALEVRSARWP
mmetsp:Transcript_8416/g.34184  ORF Transcript_8416/g.34184 Transcript_8416/m.34184 type:complete len:261 (-) Transcript_8416:145-927(-)